MIDVGQTVGNYRVTAQLGEGGMGKVFLAEHPVIRSKVALKAIHPEFARNEEVIARFINEARVVNQIEHDHIISITDFGHTPAGDFYFIMEYLQGEMLCERIGRQRFPPARAARVAAQIADALAASHERGVIHRDLKPGNILLVTRDGTPDFVKVYDFGLAKLIEPDAPADHQTSAGIVMGTPLYMSPEQCAGKPEVDHRSDIYALGVILFEMLTGRVPFTGSGYGEVMAKHINLPAPSARGLVPDLPPALEAIVARALAKEPNDRFQTMTDFRRVLLDAQGEPTRTPALGVPAREPTPAVPWPAVPSEVSLRHGAGELATPLDPRPRRRRGGLAAAGVGIAAVLALANANLGLHRHSAEVLAASPPPEQPPATVRVNFSSDPDGATVSRSDGTRVGITPLSTEIPYGDTPVEYVVHKEGYAPKVTSFVPNLPSPIFTTLQRIDPPELLDAAGESRAKARHAHHRAPAADADDVMAPSTW